MRDYRAFGGLLRSALDFPELRLADAAGHDEDACCWTLVVADPAPFPEDAAVMGAQRYPGDVEVALLRSGDRLRVRTSDIGDFDVEPGRRIVWRPSAAASEDWARFDVIGRVLPILMHLAGRLVLHGSSAVLPDGSAVAFVAPKGRGKSTLALAVAQRGGRLLSDDVTVLEERAGAGGWSGWTLLPGVHAVRLWDDSLRGLGADRYGETGRVGRKAVVRQVPEPLLADAPAPPSAVYVLTGLEPGGRQVATRRRVGDRAAALTLVRQATAGSLLGGSEGARLLGRAAGLARQVPVYELDVARDFARLDDLVRQLAAWSAAGEPGRTGRAAGAPA